MSDLVTLRAGEHVLRLAPGIGGAIADWHRRGQAVMREPTAEHLETGYVRGLGSFPLVPFSNRIAWGRFSWEGREYHLPKNFGDHPHTIHGTGWQRPWTVDGVSESSARLVNLHEPDAGWPFPFRAEQRFHLDEGGLRLDLVVENLDGGPRPFGLGIHPYFPKRPGASLRFQAARVWENGADHLPARAVPVPAHWDHTGGREIGSAELDNNFEGWDRIARIEDAEAGHAVTMTASEIFGHLVVYTPPDKPFFAVEPVSHLNDAINREGEHGLGVLGPGEALTGEVTILVEDLP